MSNEETNGKVAMSLLSPLKEIEITVQTLSDSNVEFKVFLDDLDARTDREYQRVVNGGVQIKERLKSKNLEMGRAFIFERKFLRSNIDWSNGSDEDKLAGLKTLGYESEKEYFLKDEVGKRYMTPIVHQYFGVVSPDATHTKE